MIYVIPADEHGCGYSRLIWPVQVLKHYGHQIKIIRPGSVHLPFRFSNGKLTGMMIPPDLELMVLQRPALNIHPHVITRLRAAGVAVVVDMDDDMTSIHPRNIAYHVYKHDEEKFLSWKYASESCRAATFVTTTSPELQKIYASHGRGVVIPNYVPAAYLQMPRAEADRFGWAGATMNHPDDPQVTMGAVQQLINDGHQFTIVGGGQDAQSAFRLTDKPHMTGFVPVSQWAQTIRSNFRVGMVPLAPTPFNRSKSYLKGIEYMSLGIPWVASPRDEYRRLNKIAGCGFLAHTPRQWYDMTRRLLTDDSLWREQSEAGLAFMQDQTYEAQAWRWAEAWQRALGIQRGSWTAGRAPAMIQ